MLKRGYILGYSHHNILWSAFSADDRAVKCGQSHHSLLHESKEQQAAPTRAEAVEAKCKFFEVGLQVWGLRRTLVSTQ